MPPFSGKKKKEQLQARRQLKRDQSQRAREREKAHEEALIAGADPQVLAEAEAAEDATQPRGRHALRRLRHAHGDARVSDGEDDRGDGDYDATREYKYGADRKGVRSVFQKESQAELEARRAMNYQPLTRRTVISASGVSYGSWFVPAGHETVATAVKKKMAQRSAENAVRGAQHTDSEAGRDDVDRKETPSPAPAFSAPPDLVAHYGASAVSATFPFSVELPSRGWRLDAENGQLQSTYTLDHANALRAYGEHVEGTARMGEKATRTRSSSTSSSSEEKGGAEAVNMGSAVNDSEEEEGEDSDVSSSKSAKPQPASNTPHDAIDDAEKQCFRDYLDVLDHYRLPAEIEGLQVNSYERNIDVWRQLWRTVEVSDVVVVVTDARYPIIHTPPALLRYITVELKKPCVVVLNKSDLVPASVLQSWMLFLTQFFERLGFVVESASAVCARGTGAQTASEATGVSAAPIVLVPFTADPRGGQSVIEGFTERVDMTTRWRKKEKRRAKMYAQLRSGNAHYDVHASDSGEEADDATYHSDVNFKGMKKAEHNLQQEKREYKELQVVADAITSMLALCRALVTEEKLSASHAAAETAKTAAATRSASEMEVRRMPSAPRAKAKTGSRKKRQKRQLLPSGGLAPPSDSEDDAEASMARHDEGEVSHDREPDQDAYIHVGFVGFPNVGKSSLLNCIRGTKVVSVSATPGHTKHLQTIPISAEGMTLVDCPGLSFPLFGIPRPLQAIVGTHQIAQTRDPQSGIAYLASYLPIEKIYGLSKPDGAVEDEEWTPYDLCEAYAKKRGFFVKHGKGALDVHRGAVALLQEAYEGRLPFFFAPPELNLLRAKYFESAVLPLLYLPVLHKT